MADLTSFAIRQLRKKYFRPGCRRIDFPPQQGTQPLDVDGSNFAKYFNPSHKTLISVFIPAEAEFDFAAKRNSLSLGAVLAFAALVEDCPLPRIAALPLSALIKSRAHGSLLALARNSLPDSSPDH